MMNPYAQQAQQQYKAQEIQTASPEEILILLYDGAIRFLNQAKKAMVAGNVEQSHQSLLRAQQIVAEFMASLDVDMGGEAALNLYRLYDYLHYRLVQANIKKDVTMVDEVLTHLRALKKTWEEAIAITLRETNALDCPTPLSA